VGRPEIRERVVPTLKLKVRELWLLGGDLMMASSQRYIQAAVLQLNLSKNHNYITCFGIDLVEELNRLHAEYMKEVIRKPGCVGHRACGVSLSVGCVRKRSQLGQEPQSLYEPRAIKAETWI
jgi:hypothetical protein